MDCLLDFLRLVTGYNWRPGRDAAVDAKLEALHELFEDAVRDGQDPYAPLHAMMNGKVQSGSLRGCDYLIAVEVADLAQAAHVPREDRVGYDTLLFANIPLRFEYEPSGTWRTRELVSDRPPLSREGHRMRVSHTASVLALFGSCETNCVAGCCSTSAFDPSRERVQSWVRSVGGPIAEDARRSLEALVSACDALPHDEVVCRRVNAVFSSERATAYWRMWLELVTASISQDLRTHVGRHSK